MPFLWRLCGCVVSHLDAYLTNPTISRNAMWKRSMATDNQLVRGLGGSGQHCWANQKRLDQGATTGLLCVLQNGSPIFHSFLDTMLTQNTWCWWAGGVPWCHHFVGSNPHGCYHFVGVPIPFCREVGWAPYTLVGPTSRGEFPWGWKLDVFFNDFQGPSRTIQNKQSVYKMEGRHHIHKHVHDTLALPFCSWFMLVQDIFCKNLECQATWVCWRGLWWLPLQ